MSRTWRQSHRRVVSRDDGWCQQWVVARERGVSPGGSRIGGLGFMDQWELVRVCMSTYKKERRRKERESEKEKQRVCYGWEGRYYNRIGYDIMTSTSMGRAVKKEDSLKSSMISLESFMSKNMP